MRLINVNNNKLEVFIDGSEPGYAILSHRWTKNEVSLDEFRNFSFERAELFGKIYNCCRQAARDSLEYVWVDTCCIDKSNSQELSEAINSMYRWYQKANVCYVYLEDVIETSQMPQSQWFTRGWTLQELIAPKNIQFFNKEWKFIGSKTELLSLLGQWTGITVDALSSFYPERYPVAQKMSWASKRRTTRVEDRAYSLLGIFGVNMPLNYGEGEEAFLTLQRRIIESYNDQTILVWSGTPNRKFPFLAASPSEFEQSYCIIDSIDQDGQFPPHFSPPIPVGTKNVFEHSFEDFKDILKQGCPINYQEQHERLELPDDGFHISNAGLSVSFFLVPLVPDVYVAILQRCEVFASSKDLERHNPCLCLHLESDAGAQHTFIDTFISRRRNLDCSRCLHRDSPPTRFLNVGIFLQYSRMARLYTRIALDGRYWVVYGSDCLVQMGSLQRIVVSRWPLKLETSSGRSYKVHIEPFPKRWYSRLSHSLFSNEVLTNAQYPDAAEERVEVYRRSHVIHSRSCFEMPLGEVGVAAVIIFTSSNLLPILVHLGFDESFTAFCLLSIRDINHLNINGDRANVFDSYITSKHCDFDCKASDSDNVLNLVKCLRDHQANTYEFDIDRSNDPKLFKLGRQNISKTFYFVQSELVLTTKSYGFAISVRWETRNPWEKRPNKDSSHRKLEWRSDIVNVTTNGYYEL